MYHENVTQLRIKLEAARLEIENLKYLYDKAQKRIADLESENKNLVSEINYFKVLKGIIVKE